MHSSTQLLAGAPLLLLVIATGVLANDWDAGDDTFDPKISSVIIKGYSRTGDPTPFYKDGISAVESYTSVEAKPDQNLGATVWLSLDVPFVPGQTGPQEGGELFLSVDQTEDLIQFLEEAVENPEEKRDLGNIFPEGSFEKWTVEVDPGNDAGPIVLRRNKEEEIDHFRFRINPARKLIGTLVHFREEANQLASKAP
ncbi:MAG: hypothetical protein P1U87_13215 [Verrucomicrobiales bacterium]|nr:hypothetical protein [Verrucomicrobiales bacterium]